jgi:RimJ/RimL family protein N-acetyltransferase
MACNTLSVLDVKPVVLEGNLLRLEPLTIEHFPLMPACTKAKFFELFVAPVPESDSKEDIEGFLTILLHLPNTLPFVMVLKETGRPIGSSSYLDIRREHRGLEIGRTWIAEEHRGTRVNPEAKLLMLQHAFETLGCIRVQLKTDARNFHSQRAIEKLGAKKEGALRQHMIMPNGYERDSVMYSIMPDEWAAIKSSLIARLG